MVQCLPADLHNRPEKILQRCGARRFRPTAASYASMFVAYADCGTGGLLDAVLAEGAG